MVGLALQGEIKKTVDLTALVSMNNENHSCLTVVTQVAIHHLNQKAYFVHYF